MIPVSAWLISKGGRFLLPVVALTGALGTSWSLGRMSGIKAGSNEVQKVLRAEQELSQQRLEKIHHFERVVAAMEKRHANEVAGIVASYLAEKAAFRERTERRIADLRSGTVRLRVPVNPTTCNPTPSVPTGSTPSGVNGAASAELDGAVAARILRIVADGDESIQQLTKLQAWAESAYRACKGSGPEGEEAR